MITTFRETYASIRDPFYGKRIITKTLDQSLRYWINYVILIFLIYALAFIALATYTIPQLPRLVKKYISPGSITLQHGKLSTSYPQPISYSFSDFTLTIDTTSSSSSQYKPGLIVLSDQLITKTPENQTISQSISDLPDFSISQAKLYSWLLHKQSTLWIYSFFTITFIIAVICLFYTCFQLVVFLIWSLLIIGIGKIFKHNYIFSDIFKIVVHAAVIPLLFSASFALFPNFIFSVIELGVFTFFVLSWLKNLSH